MSLLLLEGFDDDLRDFRWAVGGGLPAPAVGNSRHGKGQILNVDDTMLHTIPAADEDALITVGAWMRNGQMLTSNNNPPSFLSLRNSTDSHAAFVMQTDGRIKVYAGGVFIGYTNISVFPVPGTAAYLEFQVRVSATVGTVDIYRDGVSVFSASGIDTQTGASTTFNVVSWYGSNTGAYSPLFELDDIYITNGVGSAPYNGLLGGIIVEELFPNGNGNYSNFVGSDGNSVDNYLLVDETPHDGDTTYVESSTDTDRESYLFDNLAAASGSVLGVIAAAVMRNTGANDNVQLSTRISATDYDGATEGVPAGYGLIEKVWQVSPATAADWTIAEVNGAEFGIENVA